MTDDGGWHIGLADPLRPKRRLGRIRLIDRGLGTSGSGTQFFRHRGRRYGHILDPRTGWPAEGVYSVTVLAPTAALADGLATALYVLGPEAAQRYCQEFPGIAMFMVCRAGDRAEVRTAGFAEGELTMTSAP
jgi:thiamine biosynthesis lipoprotein